MLTQFLNLSCYKEFEMRCDLAGISKVDVLKIIGHQINDYYFFIFEDGIFNWFDLVGNHIENPGVLKELKAKHISRNITKCIIPDTITTIGYYAFSQCKSLTSITIPVSVINIGSNAFSYCTSLKEITIPNSVTSIDGYTFVDCASLKEITIPNSVISIDKYAFSYCTSLKEITIPNSVTYIGWDAFLYCKSLKEVIFKGKTLDEVKRMEKYPFGIDDKSIIKCEI